jgi:hypothetical protein
VAACSLCGQPVRFYLREHPSCVNRMIREQIKDHWEEVRAAKRSGKHAVVGVTTFVFDAVRSREPTASKRVALETLYWAYQRHVTLYALPFVPYYGVDELVMHTHDGGSFTSWKRAAYSGDELDVQRSLRELMKRAPWALFGFSENVRAAMTTDRLVQTTREIDARRIRILADAAQVEMPQDMTDAASLAIERVRSFGIRGRD